MSRVSITELNGANLDIPVKVAGKLKRTIGVGPSATVEAYVDPTEEEELTSLLEAERIAGNLSYDFSASTPKVEWIDGGAPAALGGTMIIKGSDLLQGQTFDELVHGVGTSSLTFAPMKPGASNLKVKITDTGSVTAALASGVLSIGYDAGVSDADAIATAVNAAASCTGIIRCVSGGAGTTIAELAETTLSGGEGAYTDNKVTVSGVECLPLHATGTSPAATWADGQISVTVPDLTAETDARAAGDIARVAVESDGKTAELGSVALA